MEQFYCAECDLILDLKNDELIHESSPNRFYHKECWKEYKKRTLKTKAAKEDDVLEEKAIKKIESSKKQVENKINGSIRRKLTDYIFSHYDTTYLQNYFYIKIDKVYKGELPNQSKPIKPEHLYDMWVQKQGYLDRVYKRNCDIGKKMDVSSRVNYDLAILASKYDDYLKWLERQEASKTSNKDIKETTKVTEILYHNNKREDKNDISDILDELI